MSPPRSYWDRFEAQPWKATIDGLHAYDAEGRPVMEEYDAPVLGPDGAPQVDPATNLPATKKAKRHALEEIHFRETGDAGALIDIVFGSTVGADKNQAICSLVCSSVTAPALSPIQFNALALQVKFALFKEIMSHVKKEQAPDFPGGSPDGAKTSAGPSTHAGGSGAPPKSLEPAVQVLS